MKILLVTEKQQIKEQLVLHLKPRGFDFIIYDNPLKAMDNIREIDPDIVIFRSVDFPRHWKLFLKILREAKTKQEAIFILLKADSIPFEEAAKALFLGANGIASDNFSDPTTMDKIDEVIYRYKPTSDERLVKRYIPDETIDSLEFIFTHPYSFQLITGSILDISDRGVHFFPEVPKDTSDIEPGETIPQCSLRIEDEIISMKGKAVRNNQQMSIEYIDIPSEGIALLQEYINKRPERELETLHAVNQEGPQT